jgi:hypothetical protein
MLQDTQLDTGAEIIELDAHRHVWRCCRERCRGCDNTMISTVHMGADLDHLQCAHCERMEAYVTHLLIHSSEDEEWEPRVVAVLEDPSGCFVALRH